MKKQFLPKTRKRKDKKILKKMRLIILLILVVFVCYNLYKFLTQSTLFSLTKIDILNNHLLDKKEILSKIDTKLGSNLFFIDIPRIKRRLLKIKRIKKIKVIRNFPNKIVINIEERVPVGVVNEKVFDKSGFLFTPRKNEENTLPRLYISSNKIIKDFSNFLYNLKEKNRSFYNKIVSINGKDTNKVLVTLSNFKILWGEISEIKTLLDLDEKIFYTVTVIDEIQARKFPYRFIDLRFLNKGKGYILGK